ncbi:hypothetical protein WA556_002959 [Blastocystis sp. ATCC 50177/Nand II]
MLARFSKSSFPLLKRYLATTPYQHIRLEVDGSHIATLTINRPEKKNAFSGVTIQELSSALYSIDSDSSVRGLIIKGAGDYFCAGADLSWMKDTAKMNHNEIKTDSMKLRTMLSRCDKLRIPTVAFVKGGCIGGGVGLSSTVKNVVALPSTWFLFSEVRLGIIPAVVSPFVLKRIGSAQCKRVMMIPERITAADAYRIGLVDRIVESEEAMVQYEAEWRKLVKAGAPGAVRLVSDLIDAIDGKSESEQGEVSVEMLCERRKSEEGKEGMNCFFQKTKPSWVKCFVSWTSLNIFEHL